MAERLHDNAVRWQRGDGKGHVESFFLKANDPDGDRAFWLKFTIYAPVTGEGTVGEVWAILFDRDEGHRAAKATFPIEQLTLGVDNVGVSVADCELVPGHTHGSIRDAAGMEFRWNLDFEGDRRPLRPLPYEWMYTAEAFPKSKTLTPTSDTRYDGYVQAGDRRLEVEAWPGMQGHNWQRAHAERYAWGHCNVFVDPEGNPVDAVFEGVSTKLKIGPVVTPYLTLAMLVHEGRVYAFNQAVNLVRNRCELDYESWDFVCQHGPYRLLGSLWTTKDQMVGLTYHNPQGEPAHCLNSKIAHCEMRLVERGETVLRMRSPGKAALEVTVKEPDHGVKMYL